MVPPLRSLRLITLDLTGTVFRFNRPIFSTYADVSAKHGVPCEEADIQRGFFKVREFCSDLIMFQEFFLPANHAPTLSPVLGTPNLSQMALHLFEHSQNIWRG